MPIHETYRKQALEKVERLRDHLINKLEGVLESLDKEDLEMGISEKVSVDEELWKTGVEENNYMEVVYTEIMEHHDGAYLKAIFRNIIDTAYADRYLSVRSSGKVEITHAFFLRLGDVNVRVERKPNGDFIAFLKAL